MALRTLVRRFNPLKTDAAAHADPPFDPRKQHWAAGALAAVEAFAGAVLALPFVASVVFGIGWLFSSRSGRARHHFHHVNAWVLFKLGACTLLAAALLWAGLALMFGWRSRYRAHGALALVVVATIAVSAVLSRVAAR
jgi:hypothetical protein